MAVSSNNVYVHSSPPKAISGQGAAIRQWVKVGDLDKLEQVVLDGQGARLLGLIDSTAETRVKSFLRSVPSYMAKVDLIHDAVIRGSLREIQALLDKRKLATGRDAVGRGLAHKAVLYNHKAVVEWLGKKYPETLNIKDNEGRSALHYTSASKDPDELFSLLMNLGAKELIDIHGRKPSYYMSHPENLDIEGPRTLSNNRNKRARLDSTPIPKPISSTITRAQIRIWIHERDVGKLEKIVWSGAGDKLLAETTNNNKVKKFLYNVPHLLSKIKSIHAAVISNDVETIKDIRSKTEIPEVFTAKDSHGLTGLHKAAGLAHRSVVEWFLYEFSSQLVNDQDGEGRTPLHYASKDSSTYNFLLRAGASESILDSKGKTPQYYKKNPAELDGRHLRNIPDAPRVSGDLTPWDRIVTSPGSILDPKRRISNGEFNDEEQPPVAKKFNYDSDGYNGEIMSTTPTNTTTEGKYDLPVDDVNIGHFDVEVAAGDLADDDDDFEPPVIDEDEQQDGGGGSDDKAIIEILTVTPQPPEEPTEQADDEEEDMAVEQQEEEEVTADDELEPDSEEPEAAAATTTAAEETAENENEEEIVPEADLEESNEETQTLEEESEDPLLQLEEEGGGGGGITDEQMDDHNFVDDDPEETAEIVGEAIDTGDMEKLVELVLDGRGNELLNIKSRNPEVTEFITNIPAYMAKIASIHEAAASGNLRDLQTILDRKRLAMAKDSNGLVPLHKAVLNGHSKVIRYLASNYNQSINATDKHLRTPLHYAATLSDSGATYKALIAAGADPNVKDEMGNTPGIYLRNKDLLSHADLVARAMTNNNNNISEMLVKKKAETWQRPPSGNFQVLLLPTDQQQLTKQQQLQPQQHQPVPLPQITNQHTNPVRSSQKTLELLKDAYKNLVKEESIWTRILYRLTNQNPSHISKDYIKSYMSPQVFSALSHRTTFYGATLLDVIKYYPQAFIVAPDPQSYVVFRELFYPVITDHSKFYSRVHPKLILTEPFLEDFTIPVVDIPSKFVTQVRLRLSRNIQPFPFLPLMKMEDLYQVERIVRCADKSESIRTNLEDLDRDKRKILESRGFWFPQATKVSRFWPKGRVFYTNEDLSKTIWVNGQDHLDIVVTSLYGKLMPILKSLHEIYQKLGDSMEFHTNTTLGFLTVDPFRVGSGLKVNFTIRLPSLMKERSELASKCEELNLYIVWKGSSDYVELENKISLLNEIELLTNVANAINTLIDLENMRSKELILLEQKQKKLK